MAMGRPKIFTDEVIEKLGDKLLEWYHNNPKNIFVKQFCVDNNLYEQKMQEFSAGNEYFSTCYKKAREIQQLRLIALGFEHNQKTTMSIFLLKAICGFRENEQNQQNITINNYDADKLEKGDIEDFFVKKQMRLQDKREKKKKAS